MISTLSWTINAASVALIGSQLLVPFPQFFNGYEPERWHLFLIYQGLNLLSLFYNLFLLKRTNWIHDCAFVLTLSTFFVTCITCLSRSRKQSPEWVWTKFETTTGWNDGVAFMTSLVTPCYMHGGLDAALHLAEETLNASQTVPRALMATIGIGFLTAFTFAVSMAYCISDLEGLLTSTMPIFQLWRTATRSDAAGVTFLVSLTIIVIFVPIAIQQTTSRLIWAFPRDQGLYLSDHFSQLSPKLRDIPSNALILNTVLVFLCGCLFLGSTAAFNALVGSFLLLQMISFALLAALLIYQKRSSTFLPQSRGFRVPDPVGKKDYASVVLLALLLFSVVNWFMFAKQQYQGPRVELILNQTISPNTCFEDAQTVVYISRRSRAGLKLSVFDVIANIPMRLLAAELAANSKVQGYCDARFSKLRDMMQEFIASGQDIGASLCVNINGEDVIDIWGGYADASTKEPWGKDTVVNVFSTTKLVTNLAALMLISRGVLRPEDKVSQHWPEFAANGKSEVTVGQVLAHTAGLSAWQDDMTLEDICDIKEATDKLARQKPMWTPGTRMGYHGLTQGFLVGELVRRKTGMSIDEFIREEICRPLGVRTDFQLGCRKEDWSRVAPVVPPLGPSIQEVLSQQLGYDRHSIVARTLCNPSPRAEDANTALWRSSVLGSVNGHTNAKTLVKILSCYSLGGICSGSAHRLLSPETVDLALTEHARGIDLVTGRSGRRGLGIYLTGPGSGIVEDQLPDGKVGWGSGWGC
ncbi:hypothetical protein LZL87_004368 [Fusarium oxysporum]|nr:hypothetical protein LZL87_004368 [Fusarium oxysporum]